MLDDNVNTKKFNQITLNSDIGSIVLPLLDVAIDHIAVNMDIESKIETLKNLLIKDGYLDDTGNWKGAYYPGIWLNRSLYGEYSLEYVHISVCLHYFLKIDLIDKTITLYKNNLDFDDRPAYLPIFSQKLEY